MVLRSRVCCLIWELWGCYCKQNVHHLATSDPTMDSKGQDHQHDTEIATTALIHCWLLHWHDQYFCVYMHVCTRACSKLQGIFNKHGFSASYIWVNKVFYSSVAGSTFNMNNMQQIAQESVICYPRDKLMCNGNNTGNLVLWGSSFSSSLNVMDQVSQPYKTGKNVVQLYSESKREENSNIPAAYCTVIQSVWKSSVVRLMNHKPNWQTQFCTTSGLQLPCTTIIIHIIFFWCLQDGTPLTQPDPSYDKVP
jgi:hypothetical protein